MDPTVCERCGTVFGCGAAEADCWCAAEPAASPLALAAAAVISGRCLCPDCLAAVQAEHPLDEAPA